jgi:hypothetical protein
MELDEDFILNHGFKYLEAGVYGKSGYFRLIDDSDSLRPIFLFFNNHLQLSIFIPIIGNPIYIDLVGVKDKNDFCVIMELLTGKDYYAI